MAEANICELLSLRLNDIKFTTSLLDLPNEILAKIFSMLRQEDILRNVARVCKRFLEITRTPEVLPIIRIFDTSINPILPKKMQNCMKIYPRSKIEIEIGYAKYSKMKKLGIPATDRTGTVASFVKHMTLGVVLDSVENRELYPKFENLELLWLNDIADSSTDGISIFGRMYKISGFWSHFPNLTYLYFNTTEILQGIVS